MFKVLMAAIAFAEIQWPQDLNDLAKLQELASAFALLRPLCFRRLKILPHILRGLPQALPSILLFQTP